MSVAPEIARLAEAVLLVPARPDSAPGTAPHPDHPHNPGTGTAVRLTLGGLSRELRELAATPERWWSLVQFDRDRAVRIPVEEHPSHQAWLMVLPPGDAGQTCDCDVVTIIAGEATEGAAASPVLRPGPLRVHGRQHWLRGQGAGYSISLHARAR